MKKSKNPRGIFCNRTLNLRAIRAIGYDMDYTLIHYHMKAWEQRAYSYIKEGLLAAGWPVEDLELDPDLVMRGLILDTEYGNIIKANRFGYIKKAFHGIRPLDFDAQRRLYQRTLVDLSEQRWTFLNTLFSISEACLFMQLVDRLDRGELAGCARYEDLYLAIRRSSDEAHMEGSLKAEVIAEPEKFVMIDEETPLALLDQKRAGKKILLISNSEWNYASPMLTYAFDRLLPDGMTWRDLFDIAIVSARKPDFFTYNMPAFEVVSEDGLLREHHGPLLNGHVYTGCNAPLIEESLGLAGEEILYVGDHIFVDVNVSKNISRWRTALVVRELEEEIAALEAFEARQLELTALMDEKEEIESQYFELRLDLQRKSSGYGPRSGRSLEEIRSAVAELHESLLKLDSRIAPLAQSAGSLLNANWGLLMRTGNDKSHLARQIERYADIYTARVSNFLRYTPFAYFRSHRGSLPHDPDVHPWWWPTT